MSKVLKIKRAGFKLGLTTDGKIQVEPASKLTQQQRNFLKVHKAEIIGELTQSVEPRFQKIISWLHFIGENNEEIINEVLEKCRNNQEAFQYYKLRAKELPK